MAITEVQIRNMALGHIGHTVFISDPGEQSQEAEVCNIFYDQAVQVVLEDFDWPLATKYVTLGLVEDFTDVTTPHDWTYSYRYPSDCVKVRRIVSTQVITPFTPPFVSSSVTPWLGKNDPNPPPFAIGQDDSGRLIYTDQADAVIEYTKLLTDPAHFSALFAEAVSWWLAGLICPGLAKDRKMVAGLLQMYGIILQRAEAKAANESQRGPEPESEFIRARV